MIPSIDEKEEQEIYKVISDALLTLCEQKPNDPVDFLSRKMLELIGDDPSNAVRAKDLDVDENELNKVNENIIISAEKVAIAGLNKKFDEYYRIVEQISTNTYLIEEINNDTVAKAVRIINKKDKNVFLSDKKVKMLCELDHPNIIKIINIMEDEDYIYVVHDYCPGKDILSFLVDNKEKVTDELIRQIINQILTGLAYLHANNVIHKNINPDKILVYSANLKEPELHIKISDFISNAEYYTKGQMNYKPYGNKITNPLFIAPEFLEEKYDNKVDIWSTGMIAYILLVGKPPFKGKEHEILYQIAHKTVKIPEGLSNTKRFFLEKMLSISPKDRLEASELLNDEYFTMPIEEVTKQSISASMLMTLSDKENQKKPEGNNFELTNVMNNMATFTIGQNFRRSVLSFVVSKKLYEENNTKLRKAFESMDNDHNGSIECRELFLHYRKLFPGTTREQWENIKKFVEASDINKDGKISYGEFLTVMTLSTNELSRKTLENVFNHFDVDHTGYIDALDLKELFEDTNLSDKEIHDMLDEIDKNEDRKISFEEFFTLMTSKMG